MKVKKTRIILFFIIINLGLGCSKKKEVNWWWLLLLNSNPEGSSIRFSEVNHPPSTNSNTTSKNNAFVIMNIYPNTWDSTHADYQAWDTLIASSSVDYIIAVYPPYSYSNSDYQNRIESLQQKGAKVIANVDTNYASVDIHTIKNQIDLLFTHYNLDGIYINQVPTLIGKYDDITSQFTDYVSYYREIYRYIKTKNSDYFVVLGHGGIPDTSYFSIADINVLFLDAENHLSSFFTNWESLPWKDIFISHDYAIVVKSVLNSHIDSIIEQAKKDQIHFFYLTDQTDFSTFPSTNFWNTLQSYYGN